MSTIEKKRLRWGYHKSSFFQQIHRVYNVILTYSFFSKLIKVVKKIQNYTNHAYFKVHNLYTLHMLGNQKVCTYYVMLIRWCTGSTCYM
jgi:hypothetical protein